MTLQGGLLMGNMYVQRPDLFGAIHCAVPLLDMQRYHTLLAGASWMAEYGNPDTDDWDFMQQYSPYHSTLFCVCNVIASCRRRCRDPIPNPYFR
jgi:prolyl oligopeptidase PreP (S9A serine peptidase family)